MLENILVWIIFLFIGGILLFVNYNLYQQLADENHVIHKTISRYSFIGSLVITVWYYWALVVTLLL